MMEAKVNKSLLMSTTLEDVGSLTHRFCEVVGVTFKKNYTYITQILLKTKVVDAEVYEKAMILGAVSMVGYLITGSIMYVMLMYD